jgi:Ca-activated chloride channel family protein
MVDGTISRGGAMSEARGSQSGLIAASGAAVPLAGVGVKAEMFGLFARVEVTQRFINREAVPIEAVYTFPLDEGAAVCAFEAVIDDTLVVGEIKERDAAFDAYDSAIAAGHGAYLIDRERPDVFTASIGNLPAGKEVLVRLVYVTALQVEGTAVRFVLPTTISPRYAPAEDRLTRGGAVAERLNPPVAWQVPYGLNLQVRLTTQGRPAAVDSPSHPIRVAWEGDVATVAFSHTETAMDRDFVLLAESGGLEEPRAWLERDDDGSTAVAVAFRPQLAESSVAGEIIFLVDRSGSMSGSSIADVRSALQLCLRSLPAGSRFNIVGFGSGFRPLFAESLPYDEASLALAHTYVESLDAEMGGTEILEPIRFAFECPRHRELPRQIILLTDGQVTNSEAIVQFAAGHADRARVFTFGIGAGAGHHLLRGLARVTGGAAEAIYPGERVAPKVLRQFRRLSRPAVTNLSLDWGGLKVMQAPSNVRAVFSGDCLVIYALVDDFRPSTVRLSGAEASGPFAFDVPLDAERVSPGRTLATLAARERIRELEEAPSTSRRGSLQSRATHDSAGEIVAIAKKYGLMSSETSFVAVEQRATPTAGTMQLRRVPIALTTGWGGLTRPTLSSVRPGMAAPAPVAQPLADFGAQPTGGSGLMHRLASLRAPLGFRTPSAPTAAHAQRSRTPLDTLIALQRADGSWDLTGELAMVLGTTRSRLRTANLRGAAHRCWATALAIAWLRQHAMDRSVEWDLLARKATAWLDDHAGAAEASALLRTASAVCTSAGKSTAVASGAKLP